MRKYLKQAMLAAAVGVVVLTPVAATSASDEAVIAHRQANFAAIAKIVGNISGILKGEVDNKGSLVPLTKALVAATDPDIIIPSFKVNTTGSSVPNRGVPKIWEEFEKFSGGARDMNEGAKAIAALAEKGELVSMDPMGPTLLKTCGFCHRAEKFRGPKP